MPNLNQIADVAEAIGYAKLAIVQERCVAVRNRNASCRACVQACDYNAISVSGNEVAVDALTCENCGRCAVACPTEALVTLEPAYGQTAQAALAAKEAAGGTAVIACARIASKRIADPSRYCEVPCLGHVDESLVVKLASKGARRVALVDGTCSTCKYGTCTESVDECVSEVRRFLAAAGASASVERSSSFPEEMIQPAGAPSGSTRRGFFTEAWGAAKDAALTAASATAQERLGTGAEPTIGERLRVGESGTLPQFPMSRHDALLDALYELGAHEGEDIDSRRFAWVVVDANACNACGMCAMFCPTGALARGNDGPALKSLEFSASSCVACDLCADVCWKQALTLKRRMPADQLFDFEPRTIDLNG